MNTGKLTIQVTTLKKWWVPVLVGAAKVAISLRLLRAKHTPALFRLIANHGYIVKVVK